MRFTNAGCVKHSIWEAALIRLACCKNTSSKIDSRGLQRRRGWLPKSRSVPNLLRVTQKKERRAAGNLRTLPIILFHAKIPLSKLHELLIRFPILRLYFTSVFHLGFIFRSTGMHLMTRKRQRRTGAFTLIELLVVVAIIAVLIAILVPSLGRARETARKVYCQTNLRQWGMGFSLYADSYNDILPFTGHSDGNNPGNYLAYWDDPSYWSNAAPTMLNGGKRPISTCRTMPLPEACPCRRRAARASLFVHRYSK